MKIFFLGVFKPSSTNYPQAECFEYDGHTVIRYEYRDRAKTLGNEFRDKEIVQQVALHKPDLVLFSKCNDVASWVVEECNKYSKTCLWMMDAMRHWNKQLEEKIFKCSFCCFDKKDLLEKALKFNENCFRNPEGFSIHEDYPHKVEKIYNVSFIGNLYDLKRREGCRVAKAKVINNVYGTEHSKTVSQTKINLNFCSDNSASERVYKVLASGGFLLTDDWYGRKDLFQNQKDLVIYYNDDDLKYKVHYYLKNQQEREQIAKSGLQTVQKYSKLNWATKIVNFALNV